MKLVYLWVEKYKNIREEGFCFSSSIQYKNGLLSTLKTEQVLPKNFFAKDVDVTAVIGKNGSGKSGFIESLMLTLFGAQNPNSTLKAFCIFEENEQFFYYLTPIWEGVEREQFLIRNKAFFLKNTNQSDLVLNNYDISDNNKIMILHYNYTLDTLSSQFVSSVLNSKYNGNVYDYQTTDKIINIFSQPDKSQDNINIRMINRTSQKYMIKSKDLIGEEKLKNILSQVFGANSNASFIPQQFILHFDFNSYISSFTSPRVRKSIQTYFETEDLSNPNRINIETLSKLANLFFIFRVFESLNTQKLLYGYIKLQEFRSLIETIERIDKEYNNQKDKTDEEFNYKLHEFDKAFLDDILFKFEDLIIPIHSVKDNILENSMKSLFPSIYDTAWYIDYIQGKGNQLKKLDIALFNDKSLIDSRLLENLIKNLPSFVEIEFWNNSGISFNDLSYGEKILNRFFYNLFYFYDFYQSKGFIDFKIILDELEIGLHPDWQKRFLSLLVKTGEVLIKQYKSTRIHFILASHSTFLLSDLPKQNVIFLDRDKNGNCKVVGGPNDKKNTFASNIHTLLSDSFFMDNDLMGTFAKEKIQEVIQFLNPNLKLYNGNKNTINKDDALATIKLIGEPFLHKKLLEMFEYQYGLPKDEDEELIEIDEEIRKLEKRKLELEIKNNKKLDSDDKDTI